MIKYIDLVKARRSADNRQSMGLLVLVLVLMLLSSYGA